MPKHKSFLADYIDSDKNEELRRNKAEIDEKILHYVKENQNDGKRTVAADLIEDIHSYYNSLYAHYNHMTEELSKKADISSSDSSDHDDSPRKKGVKNGKIASNFDENAAVARIKELEMQLDSSHNYVREFEKQRDDELFVLQEKLDEQEKDSLSCTNDLIAQNKSLLLQVKDLKYKISELEKLIEDGEHKMTSVGTTLKDARNEASIQISAMEDKVNSLLREVEIQQLVKIAWEDQCKKLEAQLQNYQEHIISSEEKVEAITERFQKEIDAKDKEVHKLEDTIEELKQELEMKIDEIGTLVENMRTTEVKQRLTSQKLRITEQLLGEKDEIHRQRVDKLLEEGKLLEEKNRKLLREITEKVHDTLARINALSTKFEDDYANIESRVYKIVNEVGIVIKWISKTKVEKGQLKKENSGLVQQLKDRKEHELLLMAKIEELRTTLSKNTDGMNRLIQTMKEHEEDIEKLKKTIQERDEKLVDLERHMKEKEEGIISLSEEKREAIRQLCILIDYHQNRYNYLRDMIRKKGGRRRLSTTT